MKLARTLATALACAGLLAAPGCQKGSDDKAKDKKEASSAGDAGSTKGDRKKRSSSRPKREKIPPPADVAAPPADAKKTQNGVAYKILTPGKPDAQKPGPNDTVVVHYTGWTTDGEMFDSSVARKHPARF